MIFTGCCEREGRGITACAPRMVCSARLGRMSPSSSITFIGVSTARRRLEPAVAPIDTRNDNGPRCLVNNVTTHRASLCRTALSTTASKCSSISLQLDNLV
ncbi:MAG: hypothetical protein LUC85_01615 [Bacteroidales bacterium]|nr:hypothetical protein [Bacteroidales bacterium]